MKANRAGLAKRANDSLQQYSDQQDAADRKLQPNPQGLSPSPTPSQSPSRSRADSDAGASQQSRRGGRATREVVQQDGRGDGRDDGMVLVVLDSAGHRASTSSTAGSSSDSSTSGGRAIPSAPGMSAAAPNARASRGGYARTNEPSHGAAASTTTATATPVTDNLAPPATAPRDTALVSDTSDVGSVDVLLASQLQPTQQPKIHSTVSNDDHHISSAADQPHDDSDAYRSHSETEDQRPSGHGGYRGYGGGRFSSLTPTAAAKPYFYGALSAAFCFFQIVRATWTTHWLITDTVRPGEPIVTVTNYGLAEGILMGIAICCSIVVQIEILVFQSAFEIRRSPYIITALTLVQTACNMSAVIIFMKQNTIPPRAMLSNGLCAAILGIFTSAIAMILFIIDNAVLWNVPKVLSASERKLAYATMTTMWYILLGSVCIKFIEHWDLETSCQFAVVTLLTIGYGNIAPKTIGGRFFMMLYTIIGLGIFGFYAVAFEENILESAKREAIVQIDLMSRMLKGAKRSNPGSLAITQGGSGGNANSNGYGSVYSSRAEFSGVPIQRFWSTDSYLAGSGNHLNELPLSTTLTMVPTMGSSFSEHSLAIYPTERSELGTPTRRDTHVSHPLSHSMLLPLSRTHSMSGEVEKILAEFEKQWLSHWKAIRAVLFTVGVWLTSAGIFAVLEPRWSYLESMYFCFVTMTGIGYGDFVPERPWAIEYWYIFIFIAVGIFAFFVGLVGEHIGVRFASQHAKTVERMTQRELKYRKRKADEEQRAYQLRMHQQQHKMNVGDHAQEGKGKAGYGKAAAGHPEETVLGRRLTHEPASHHEP